MKIEKKDTLYNAWAEIQLSAIEHNLREIRRLVKVQAEPSVDTALLPVIKADGYGHGMVEIARLLSRQQVEFFAVSDLSEAQQLRAAGIKQKILLLEGVFPPQAAAVVSDQLRPAVYTVESSTALSQAAVAQKANLPIHIKVDTGMNRLGVPLDQAETFIRHAASLPGITVEGIMTHFPLADRDGGFTRRQIKDLQEVIMALSPELTVTYVHAANSMGLIGFQSPILNLARPGLMLYGLYPKASVQRQLELRPALSVKARVLCVKTIAKGDGVSYGHSFVASRSKTIATLSIGYSNGYARCLSNNARVLINGQRCPVVGTVTMDQIMVDVSRVQDVRPGQPVTILGEEQGQQITADDLAGWAGTISYEVLCQLGNNLPRVYTV